MIRLRFVPRPELAPPAVAIGPYSRPLAVWTSGDADRDAVGDRADTPHLVNGALVGAPLTPLLAADRGRSPVFRFSFKLVQTARIEGLDDVPMYESDTYELVDQWAGDPARACLCLEDDLQRLVLRPHRRVVVTGGYVNAP